VLHLILKYRPDIPVLFNDSGVEFPETREFVEKLASLWNLNLHIAKPKENEDFWACAKKYGWPILGKSVSSNVERALRTGNIRDKLSFLEKKLVENQVRISTRCCQFTRENPSKQVEKELNADLKILGIMASESRARVRLWTDHGDHYYVKRYFSTKEGIWKVSPISIWTENDIWEYHRVYNIPYCRLYDMGHKRNGCWPCAMGFRYGHLERLRKSHPKLFNFLIFETEMGAELLKAKYTIAGLEKQAFGAIQKSDIKHILDYRPCYFDKA
jgi:3'-phosphoadenosine 5'-phosphosulfate sulfotransferase (PAPS reductase)/FAD synthetase